MKEAARFLLKKGRPLMIAALIWQSGWKYLGYRLGRDYQKLPRRVLLLCTSDKGTGRGRESELVNILFTHLAPVLH